MNRRPLKKIAAELATVLKSETNSVIKAGRLLAEAKEQLDQHGEWLVWLSENFAHSSRTAQRYQAAHAFALKYDTVSHLRLSTSALYSLVDAERAGHHEAVEAALAEAKTQWIDDFRVWGIVASLQPPPELPPDEAGDEWPEPDAEGDDEAPEDEPEPEPADDRPPPTPPPGLSPRQAAQLSKFEAAAKELLGLAARSAREFLDTGISDFDLQTAADFLHRVAMEKEKLKAAGSGTRRRRRTDGRGKIVSIKLQKRGASWRLRFDLPPDASGARQRRSATFTGTKAEAQAQAAKLLATIANGVDVNPSTITIADHLRSWLGGPHGLSAKTVERYEQLSEQQVIPHLGGLTLQKLRPAHIASWHAELLKGGGQGGRPLSARTTGHAHRVLHRSLEIALARELVARNVASVIQAPKVADIEVKALKADQVTLVLEALKGHWLEPIVVLALTSGARRGEILGLSWGSVDLVRGSMSIEGSLEQTRAGLSFKQPKTRSGRRHVSLPVLAIEALKAHRLRQLETRMRLGLGNWARAGHDAAQPMPPNNLSRDWAIFVKARKLPPISFHSLRHSHASLLISSKLDPVSVARRIGHASASTTMRIYAHLWKESDGLAANAIDVALGKS